MEAGEKQPDEARLKEEIYDNVIECVQVDDGPRESTDVRIQTTVPNFMVNSIDMDRQSAYQYSDKYVCNLFYLLNPLRQKV